mgnify:CR=1 FL=1
MEDNEITKEILSWKGTRWRHLQSVKSEGVDCIQFPVAVAKNLGWLPANFKTIKYSRDWAIHNSRSILVEELSKVATCLSSGKEEILTCCQLKPGDVFVFNIDKAAGHTGMFLEDGMFLHAHVRRGVILEPLSLYKDKLHSVWRFNK